MRRRLREGVSYPKKQCLLLFFRVCLRVFPSCSPNPFSFHFFETMLMPCRKLDPPSGLRVRPPFSGAYVVQFSACQRECRLNINTLRSCRSLPKARVHDHGIPLGAAEKILNVDVIGKARRCLTHEWGLLLLLLGVLLRPAVRHATHVGLLRRSRSHLRSTVETHVVWWEASRRSLSLVGARLLKVLW